MKNRLSQARLLAAGAVSLLSISVAISQEPTSAEGTAAATPATTEQSVSAQQPAATGTVTSAGTTATAKPKLPYGAEDIVKLSKAQISEEVILTYIQNSGTIYNLGATDVVTLRNEGVSDRVINNMLDQRKRAAEAAAQQPAQIAVDPAAMAYAPVQAAAPTYVQPAYPQQAPVYTPPAEVESAPSTLYVIPYPAATYAYYGRPSYYSTYSSYAPYYGNGGYCGYARGCYPYRSSLVTIHSGYYRRH